MTQPTISPDSLLTEISEFQTILRVQLGVSSLETRVAPAPAARDRHNLCLAWLDELESLKEQLRQGQDAATTLKALNSIFGEASAFFRTKPVPTAFPGGMGRMPSNPILRAALTAIWKGGSNCRRISAGWSPGSDGPVFAYLGSRRGQVLLSVPDWETVKQLGPLAADVLLGVLAQMLEPSLADLSLAPRRKPFRVSLSSLRQNRGLKRSGKERKLFEEKLDCKLRALLKIRIEAKELPAYNDATLRWNSKGESWNKDRLISLLSIHESEYQLRVGDWSSRFLNTGAKPWIVPFSGELLSLDHRANRGVDLLAKKVGSWISLNRSRRGILIRIRTLLDRIGELPIEAVRPKDWAGRLRGRLDEALLRLQEMGIIRSLEWPDGHGPGDPDRARGWTARWLSARLLLGLGQQPRKVAPSPLSFGRNLARQRKLRSLSQKELANQLGISRPYLSRLERELATPSGRLKARIEQWMSPNPVPN